MPFKITTRGNGITNSRIHTVRGSLSYNPSKLKKYIVERKGIKIYAYNFQLECTDTNVKLVWEGGT